MSIKCVKWSAQNQLFRASCSPAADVWWCQNIFQRAQLVPHMAVTHSTECLNRAKESLSGAIIMLDWNAQLYTVLAMECLRLSVCIYVCLCVHMCVHTDTHASIYVCMCTMSLAFCPAVIKLITMAFLSRSMRHKEKKMKTVGFM